MGQKSRVRGKTHKGEIGRRQFLAWTASASLMAGARRTFGAAPDTDRIVVLTFDDAVKTQRTFVAPLLKELGFGATFFVTHCWMIKSKDSYATPADYMTWQEIAEIHQMGFEIGNHSWTHPFFSVPRDAARLPAELALVDRALQQVGVPRPDSFAWCSNMFRPEAVQTLAELGYKRARRGMQPEVPFGTVAVGPAYDPQKQNPLLTPTTGDNYPGWTLEHFQQVAERSRDGQIAVFQFHGVPDPHPFVNCPPESFRVFMDYLKKGGFRVVAMRDLQPFVPSRIPDDPVLKTPFLGPPGKIKMVLPTEVEATQADLPYWLNNMITYHHYTGEEVEKVTGLGVEVLKSREQELGLEGGPKPEPARSEESVRVLPYPGGRHPRIGFLEGAVCPMRGTKASIFLPWDPASYLVVDLPEALRSNLGLIFLAHTHTPSIWNDKNIWLENVDWERRPEGNLQRTTTLPNKIAFGGSVQPSMGKVDMELWLRNDTAEKLTGMRTQICVMLKGAPEFNALTNDNKILRSPACAVKSAKADRWIVTAWDQSWRAWANPLVPCMHADPELPDCLPGQTVKVRGRLWFYAGNDIDQELGRAQQTFTALPAHG